MTSKPVTKGKGTPPPAKPASKQAAAASLDFSALDLARLEEEVVKAAGEPLHVPWSEVYDDPDNPRTEYPEADIEELAASVKQYRILQPIVVWPRDERGYKIRFGHKRRRAAERAAQETGIMTVPVVFYDGPPLDAFAQIAENRHRDDLSPMDLARFIQKKLGEGLNAAEIARRICADKSTITYHVALLEHPEPIRGLYTTGRCRSPKSLWELGNLHRKHPAEVEAFLRADDEEITRTSIRQLAASLNGEGAAAGTQERLIGSESVGPSNTQGKGAAAVQAAKGEGKGAADPDPNVTALVTRMQEHFGQKVRLDYRPQTGKGSVTFSFFSLDELDGLLQKWKVPKQ